jgi:hypothetical protein
MSVRLLAVLALLRSKTTPVLARGRRWAWKLAPDVLFLGGLLLVAGGTGMIYRPAGVIVAGAAVSAVVFLAERKS